MTVFAHGERRRRWSEEAGSDFSGDCGTRRCCHQYGAPRRRRSNIQIIAGDRSGRAGADDVAGFGGARAAFGVPEAELKARRPQAENPLKLLSEFPRTALRDTLARKWPVRTLVCTTSNAMPKSAAPLSTLQLAGGMRGAKNFARKKDGRMVGGRSPSLFEETSDRRRGEGRGGRDVASEAWKRGGRGVEEKEGGARGEGAKSWEERARHRR